MILWITGSIASKPVPNQVLQEPKSNKVCRTFVIPRGHGLGCCSIAIEATQEPVELVQMFGKF